jgi:hypothetical protein
MMMMGYQMLHQLCLSAGLNIAVVHEAEKLRRGRMLSGMLLELVPSVIGLFDAAAPIHGAKIFDILVMDVGNMTLQLIRATKSCFAPWMGAWNSRLFLLQIT